MFLLCEHRVDVGPDILLHALPLPVAVVAGGRAAVARRPVHEAEQVVRPAARQARARRAVHSCAPHSYVGAGILVSH